MISGIRMSAASAIAIHGRRVTKFDQCPHMPTLAGSSEGRIRLGSAIELMKRPASDMNAGRSVIAASTAVATAIAAV